MRKVVLIGCVKTKNKDAHTAEFLYKSADFRKCLQYARTLTNDEDIYILSAKYGLIHLKDEVEYYEAYLGNFKKKERIEWAKKTREQVEKEFDLDNTEFTCLASIKYYEGLNLPNLTLPLGGLTTGRRLKRLNELLCSN